MPKNILKLQGIITNLLQWADYVDNNPRELGANRSSVLAEDLRAAVKIMSDDKLPTILEHGYHLAMMGLQSNRYAHDVEYKEKVDKVIEDWRQHHA